MLKIKAVNHGKKPTDKNRYCGPSALSAVTGMTTGEAARLLRNVGGRSCIKGTYSHEMARAFEQCNITMTSRHQWSHKGRMTLGQWLKHTSSVRGSNVFLVSAGNHWQLVQGRRYVCGLTGEIVPQSHSRVKRKARVREVYHLTTTGKVIKPIEARKPKATTKVNPNYLAFRKYCKDKGLTYKVAYDDYIEFSDGVSFPHYGCWDETMHRHDRGGEEW